MDYDQLILFLNNNCICTKCNLYTKWVFYKNIQYIEIYKYNVGNISIRIMSKESDNNIYISNITDILKYVCENKNEIILSKEIYYKNLEIINEIELFLGKYTSMCFSLYSWNKKYDKIHIAFDIDVSLDKQCIILEYTLNNNNNISNISSQI